MLIIETNENPDKLLQILDSFNKNTKYVDLHDRLEQSIFLQFDKIDSKTGIRDGKFNDTEWNVFEQFRNNLRLKTLKADSSKTKINKHGVVYYNQLIQKYNNQIEKKEQNWNKLYKINYFTQMLEFEKTHNIGIIGLEDESENHENIIDIEPFNIGIAREEKNKFEGTYKKAYIKGFENLTKEQQKEFMTLYKKAFKQSKKSREIGNEEAKIFNKLCQAIIMKDACETGYVSENYSSKEIIDKTIDAWNSTNPYLKQIKEIKNQISEERLKFNFDASKIKNLEEMLNHLYDISRLWSFKYIENQDNTDGQKAVNLSATCDVTERSSNSMGSEEFLSQETSANLDYGNPRLGLSFGISHKDMYRIHSVDEQSSDTKNHKQTNLFNFGSKFNFEKFNIRHRSMWIFDDDFKMQDHSVILSYDNTNLSLNKNITTIQMPEYNPETREKTLTDQSTESTTLSLSQQIGKGSASISMTSADEGKTYSANGSYTFTKTFGKEGENKNHLALSLIPSANYNYLKLANRQLDTLENEDFMSEQPSNVQTLSFGANLNAGFKYRKLSGNLNVNENLTTQFPQTTNNLTTILNLNYKNFGIKTAHTVMSSNQMNMNTFAAGISYNNGTVEVGAEYSRTGTTSKIPDFNGEMAEKTNICRQLMVTAKVYIDKLFK